VQIAQDSKKMSPSSKEDLTNNPHLSTLVASIDARLGKDH